MFANTNETGQSTGRLFIYILRVQIIRIGRRGKYVNKIFYCIHYLIMFVYTKIIYTYILSEGQKWSDLFGLITKNK